MHLYLPAVLNLTFIVFAVSSYLYIFRRFAKGNRMRSNSTASTSIDLFRSSRFYIATMLIASFVVFVVTPSLTLSVLQICNVDLSVQVRLYAYISEAVSDLVDGVIYVFMYVPVRNLASKKLSKILHGPVPHRPIATSPQVVETRFHLRVRTETQERNF